MLKAWNEGKTYSSGKKMNDEVAYLNAFPKLYNYPKAFSRFILNVDTASSFNSLKIEGPLVRIG